MDGNKPNSLHPSCQRRDFHCLYLTWGWSMQSYRRQGRAWIISHISRETSLRKGRGTKITDFSPSGLWGEENFSVISVQKNLPNFNPSGHLHCWKSNNTHEENKDMAANSRLHMRQEQPFYQVDNPRTPVLDLRNVIQTRLGPDQETGWRWELWNAHDELQQSHSHGERAGQPWRNHTPSWHGGLWCWMSEWVGYSTSVC